MNQKEPLGTSNLLKKGKEIQKPTLTSGTVSIPSLVSSCVPVLLPESTPSVVQLCSAVRTRLIVVTATAEDN